MTFELEPSGVGLIFSLVRAALSYNVLSCRRAEGMPRSEAEGKGANAPAAATVC